ncbi:MAG: TonB family protein [Pyrinomonadaceae bacterium]|nr:TonB family protein [Pyrinomonadaceae bacterium]MDQ3134982.1 TonB family protein [Acidobacteriota bacterium]
MKEIRFSTTLSSAGKSILSLSLLLLTAAGLRAQLAVEAAADSTGRRITRARALSAIGNLPAARSELESLLREPVADSSVREIALVLLVGVYLDQADYTYAESALNEAFRKRTAQDEAATRAYFAVAGQIINGVRAHVERYRVFGLNITDAELPAEAVSDLDLVRTLLERVIAQGKTLQGENSTGLESAALLEEAAALRTRLARNDAERTQWQRAVADARQHMMGSTERRVSAPSATAATPAAVAAANAHASSGAATANAPATTPPTTGAPPLQAAVIAQPSPSPTPAAAIVSANQPTSTNTSAAVPRATSSTAAPADAPAQPVEVGSLIAKATQRVNPPYPPTARSARAFGKVTVYLQLDETGAIASVRRTDGPELLRRVAEDAARRWKFRPTVINGQPVRVSGYVSFNFTL